MKSRTANICLIITLFLGSAKTSFALPPCETSWHNCFGTYTWSDKNKYVGEWRNGTRHGEGTLTFSNGAKYVGKFRMENSTDSTATSANGDKYVGEFKDGKRNGQGTYTFAKSGNKYVGEWKEGKGHGQGTLTLPMGTNTSVNSRTTKRTDRAICFCLGRKTRW